MNKIFKVTRNNGDWGGMSSSLVIAKTEEDAVKLSGYTKSRGVDLWASEYDPNKSLYIKNKDEFDVDITITIKEKVT
jgi:hypothetical protein